MKIDLDWIKKELDAGREVELEGINGCYINKDSRVLSVECDGMVVSFGTGKMWFSPDSFKNFRIKQASTFDDLIDILIKAKKDNIVSRVEIKRNSLNATVNVTESRITEFCTSKNAGGIVFKERIDWINSLYTETFVIESEEDLKRIKLGSKITLLNEQVITVRAVGNYGVYFEEDKSIAGELILKGATVTQKRGK